MKVFWFFFPKKNRLLARCPTASDPQSKMTPRIPALLALLLLAAAAPNRLALHPGNTEIGFRVYGFGLVPVDGRFARFQGTLTTDPADPAACSIEIAAEIDSLAMPSAEMRETALAPGLLDAPAHPKMSFRGRCQGDRIAGELALHGFEGPMVFTLDRSRGTLEAEGSLRRAAWGMTGSPALIGQTVRIRLSLRDPQLPGPQLPGPLPR